MQGFEQQGSTSSEDMDQAKERYLKFFLIDFLEFNLRKVTYENTTYCSQQCNLFDNLKNTKQNSEEFNCLERCLSKFSHSYYNALD